jgi:hypothetical protein
LLTQECRLSNTQTEVSLGELKTSFSMEDGIDINISVDKLSEDDGGVPLKSSQESFRVSDQ